MKSIFIKKIIAVALTYLTLFGVLPIAANAATSTGWVYENNQKWYYYNNNGVMQKDTTIKEGTKEYKLGPDGAWIQGGNSTSSSTVNGGNTEGSWKQENNKWYFYDKAGVMQKNTTVISDGKEYILGADGAWNQGQNNTASDSAKGLWILDKGKWHFCSKADNSYVKGWLNYDRNWYYLDNDGVMLKSTTLKIDGKEYRFADDGTCNR